MTVSSLKAVPMGVLTVVVIGVLLSYADVALRLRGALPVGSSNLFVGALVGLTIGTLIRAAASPSLRARVLALYNAHTSILLPLAGIVWFALVSALLPTANWVEGAHWALLPVYDVITVLLAMLLALESTRRRYLRAGLVVAFVLLLGSVAVDLARPGTFSNVEFRAAGFAVNANGAAFILIFLACTIIRFDRVRPFDLCLLLLTALGVFATLSRGGTLLLTCLVLGYAYCGIRRARGGPLRALGRLAAIGAVGVLAYFAIGRIMQRATLFTLDSDRLEIFRGHEEALKRSDSRFTAFEVWWHEIQEAPILGYGSGFTYDDMGGLREGPHNMYLQQWVNSGIGGLACYVWLLAAAVRLFWRRRDPAGLVFMVMVLIQGVVSHNLLDERAFLLPFGVLLTTSYRTSAERSLTSSRPEAVPSPLSPQIALRAGRSARYRPT
jgi:O-antigen ligase